MIRRLLSHLRRREFTQFLVDQRQQFLGRLGIAGFDGLQDAGNVGHKDKDTAANRVMPLAGRPRGGSTTLAISRRVEIPSFYDVTRGNADVCSASQLYESEFAVSQNKTFDNSRGSRFPNSCDSATLVLSDRSVASRNVGVVPAAVRDVRPLDPCWSFKKR